MRRYNLRHDVGGTWLVVDGVTTEPANLDDVALSGMGWPEACDMVALLNCLDAIENASRDYEALAAAE
ncbi:hypothetical protein QA646_06925 [Rhizobium sp. CB3090]|uniref:hypothetical protein n=1 Tax=Rhizobium sp. CB3090 TaxID=3039156 RepID=UPI0024B248B0|nr:hypothetical protein [Rhizobium sp. CB3090]WFU10574.1 hypothetical protein QA646_06925 [Rhizobium sp. CB3090]